MATSRRNQKPSTPRSALAYVYVLKDPRTDAIRYVGKSKNPRQRLGMHLRVGQTRAWNPYEFWIRALKSLGLKPVMEAVAAVPLDILEDLERQVIEDYTADPGFLILNTMDSKRIPKRKAVGRWAFSDKRPERDVYNPDGDRLSHVELLECGHYRYTTVAYPKSRRARACHECAGLRSVSEMSLAPTMT